MMYWIIATGFFSALRFFFDGYFMSRPYEIYYYYDSLFQPVARFALAMALFTVFVYFSTHIESFAQRNPLAHKTISSFSDVSYEFYLTHQFILLAFYEFIPYFHTGLGLVVWIAVSFIITVANTLLLVFIKHKTLSLLNNMSCNTPPPENL